MIDNITDTVVHLANFGVYGTDKTIDFKNNYLGSANKAVIQKGIYDQTLNYIFHNLHQIINQIENFPNFFIAVF